MSEVILTSRDELTAIVRKAISDALVPLLTNLPTPVKPDDDIYINVEQAAALLHKKPSTIYFLVRNRKFPVYKNGNKLLFKKAELQQWVEQGKQRTNDELSVAAKQRIH
jgi:excisionase family DNA binding protein